MLKVYVDSGSSIKQDEKTKYNVEILPLKIMFGEKEYLDGIDLSYDEFYHHLIDNKEFPKTSLPNATNIAEEIDEFTSLGNDVIILCISSKISGTYNYLNLFFNDNPRVHVIDTLSAVGGVRLIVEEINKYREENINVLLEKINKLIPKIRIVAIPEVLTYLHRGGRLSKTACVLGTIAQLKPVITFKDGAVTVLAKIRGLKHAIKALANFVKELNCDTNYQIIPSYTYSDDNLKQAIELLDEPYKRCLSVKDNLDAAIAAHWGPNAFGFIFVAK